jgi:hypothetical protein
MMNIYLRFELKLGRTRKTPVRHTVRSYKRKDGTTVSSRDLTDEGQKLVGTAQEIRDRGRILHVEYRRLKKHFPDIDKMLKMANVEVIGS